MPMLFRGSGSSRRIFSAHQEAEHTIPDGMSREGWIAALSGATLNPKAFQPTLGPREAVELKALLLCSEAHSRLSDNLVFYIEPTFRVDDPYIERVLSKIDRYCVGLSRALPLNAELTAQDFADCLEKAGMYAGPTQNSMKVCHHMAAHTFLAGHFGMAVRETLIRRREQLDSALRVMAHL